MTWPALAAITEQHRPGGSNNGCLFLTVLQAAKSRSGVSLADGCLLAVCSMAHTHTHTDGGRERWLLSLPLLKRTAIPSWGLYHHDLIYS